MTWGIRRLVPSLLAVLLAGLMQPVPPADAARWMELVQSPRCSASGVPIALPPVTLRGFPAVPIAGADVTWTRDGREVASAVTDVDGLAVPDTTTPQVLDGMALTVVEPESGTTRTHKILWRETGADRSPGFAASPSLAGTFADPISLTGRGPLVNTEGPDHTCADPATSEGTLVELFARPYDAENATPWRSIGTATVDARNQWTLEGWHPFVGQVSFRVTSTRDGRRPATVTEVAYRIGKEGFGVQASVPNRRTSWEDVLVARGDRFATRVSLLPQASPQRPRAEGTRELQVNFLDAATGRWRALTPVRVDRLGQVVDVPRLAAASGTYEFTYPGEESAHWARSSVSVRLIPTVHGWKGKTTVKRGGDELVRRVRVTDPGEATLRVERWDSARRQWRRHDEVGVDARGRSRITVPRPGSRRTVRYRLVVLERGYAPDGTARTRSLASTSSWTIVGR